MYKTYCILDVLKNKSLGYLALDKEIYNFKYEERVFGKNDKIMNTLKGLTCEMSYIKDKFYLGNAYNARNYRNLKLNNIGLIVNCTNDILNFFEDDFEYINLKVEDSNKDSIIEQIDNKIDEIHNYIINNKKNVLIHCFMGSSRSASVLLGYMIKYEKIRVRDGLNYLKEKRDLVNINKKFFHELLDYEKQIME